MTQNLPGINARPLQKWKLYKPRTAPEWLVEGHHRGIWSLWDATTACFGSINRLGPSGTPAQRKLAANRIPVFGQIDGSVIGQPCLELKMINIGWT